MTSQVMASAQRLRYRAVMNPSNRLDVPLRERNLLLTAAGYAPMYAERQLDDPALASARRWTSRCRSWHWRRCSRPTTPLRWRCVTCVMDRLAYKRHKVPITLE